MPNDEFIDTQEFYSLYYDWFYNVFIESTHECNDLGL